MTSPPKQLWKNFKQNLLIQDYLTFHFNLRHYKFLFKILKIAEYTPKRFQSMIIKLTSILFYIYSGRWKSSDIVVVISIATEPSADSSATMITMSWRKWRLMILSFWRVMKCTVIFRCGTTTCSKQKCTDHQSNADKCQILKNKMINIYNIFLL